MQLTLLLLFLGLAAAVVTVFIIVYRSSRKAEDNQAGMANALQKRFWFILILVVVLSFFFSITLPKSPYYFFAEEQPSTVIHVASRQFDFIMSHHAIDPANPVGESSIVIAPNELVEFRVTSLDVNHGFAIYNENKQIVAQTQAMPGYVNNLRWKFREPGVYTVYCLEYCGMGHQIMKTSFTVKR